MAVLGFPVLRTSVKTIGLHNQVLAIQLMILEICHLKLQNDVFLKSLHLHPKRMAKKINRGWQKLVSVSVVCRPRYLHPVVSLLGKHKDRIIMRCSKEHWQS